MSILTGPSASLAVRLPNAATATAILTALAVTAASPLVAQDPATTADDALAEAPVAEATPLRFAWPVGVDAVVTEESVKKGRSATMRYRVRLATTDDPDVLRVQIRDLEFLALDDLDLTDPAIAEALAPALGLAQAIPDFRVGRDGEFLGATDEDLDEVLDRLQAFYDRIEPGEAAQNRRILTAMRSGPMREALRLTGRSFWDCWAGTWAGLQTADPGVREADLDFPAGERTVTARERIEHHGTVDAPAGHVRLSRSVTIGGDQAVTALAGAAREMLAGTDLAAPDVGAVAEASLAMSAGAVIEPDSCRPATAWYEKRIRIQLADERSRTSVERHEYTFRGRRGRRPTGRPDAAVAADRRGRDAAGLPADHRLERVADRRDREHRPAGVAHRPLEHDPARPAATAGSGSAGRPSTAPAPSVAVATDM